MSIIDHIILFSFLILFFIFWGRYNYNIKDNKRFWLSALLPIIAYSIIIGCRYGWGNDYMWYKYQFEHPNSIDVINRTQKGLWSHFNRLLDAIGLNYAGAFITYSLIFIVCAFILMRSYGKESKYMFAFFLPATLLITTFTIRQSVAFSFVLLAIYFANKRDWIKASIVISFSFFIHSASLISVVWIAAFWFVKRPISWKITIPVYIFFAFIWDVSQLGFINNYIKLINLGESHFQGFIEDSDRWFSAEAIQNQYFQSTFTLTLSALFHVCMIFFCYKCLKDENTNRSIISLYNVIVIALIVSRAGFAIELIRRMGDTMFSVYFIPLGYCWNQYYKKNEKRFNKKTRYFLIFSLYFIMGYLIVYFGRWLLFFDDLSSFNHLKSMFIWNL